MEKHSFKEVKIEISVSIDFFNPLLQHAIIAAGRAVDFTPLWWQQRRVLPRVAGSKMGPDSLLLVI